MTDPTYTPEQRRADQRAVTDALLPVVDPVLAEMGITLREAMALMAAGEPPPPRGVVSANRRNRRADDGVVRDPDRAEDQA